MSNVHIGTVAELRKGERDYALGARTTRLPRLYARVLDKVLDTNKSGVVVSSTHVRSWPEDSGRGGTRRSEEVVMLYEG